MPLSNAQYDEIMHEYDERQLHNRHILETRRAERPGPTLRHSTGESS